MKYWLFVVSNGTNCHLFGPFESTASQAQAASQVQAELDQHSRMPNDLVLPIACVGTPTIADPFADMGGNVDPEPLPGPAALTTFDW